MIKIWANYIRACEERCENLNEDNLYIPLDAEYVDFGEAEEIVSISSISADFVTAEKYKNKTVKLNKPFRTSDGPKKFSVYVKNEKGNVVKVNFGDPNMEIKRDNPDNKKNFCSRHNCDNPGPKWKAKFWSCREWRC